MFSFITFFTFLSFEFFTFWFYSDQAYIYYKYNVLINFLYFITHYYSSFLIHSNIIDRVKITLKIILYNMNEFTFI